MRIPRAHIRRPNSPAAFAGRGLGVDGFEVVFDDVGVDLGGLDAALAEHFLDVTDAGGGRRAGRR